MTMSVTNHTFTGTTAVVFLRRHPQMRLHMKTKHRHIHCHSSESLCLLTYSENIVCLAYMQFAVVSLLLLLHPPRCSHAVDLKRPHRANVTDGCFWVPGHIALDPQQGTPCCLVQHRKEKMLPL